MARAFGTLREKKGKPLCTPRMDDLSVSSAALGEHVEHVELLAKQLRLMGSSSSLRTRKINQQEIQTRGCIFCAEGRKPALQKVEQLVGVARA